MNISEVTLNLFTLNDKVKKFLRNDCCRMLVFLVLPVMLLVGQVDAAQAAKIGFVNIDRILRDSKFAVDSQKKLERDFSRRQKELEDLANKVKNEANKLDKDAITLSDADKAKRQRDLTELDRDFQRKRREFEEDLAQRKNQLLGELIERSNKIIRQIAEKENFDIIFQEAVYANKRIDVTDQVLSALDGGK